MSRKAKTIEMSAPKIITITYSEAKCIVHDHGWHALSQEKRPHLDALCFMVSVQEMQSEPMPDDAKLKLALTPEESDYIQQLAEEKIQQLTEEKLRLEAQLADADRAIANPQEPMPHYIVMLYHLHQRGVFADDNDLALAHIKHDDWCPIFHGNICSCRPNVIVHGRTYLYADVMGLN